MHTRFLVVVYGKSLENSPSLKSLETCDLTGCCELIIFNNGPSESSLKETPIVYSLAKKFNSIVVVDYLLNAPLSYIYNWFLNGKFECYIIFDDDTFIPENYHSYLTSSMNDEKISSIDLFIPIIVSPSKSEIFYPIVNDCVLKEKKEIRQYDDVISIGSGLVIFNSAIEKFNKIDSDLFDERFALYGVDFSFFRRIRKIKDIGFDFNIKTTLSLPHELSSQETFISDWRRKERLIDEALSIRFYSDNKLILIKSLLKKIIKLMILGEFKNVIFFIRSFLRGQHPRCQQPSKDLFLKFNKSQIPIISYKRGFF